MKSTLNIFGAKWIYLKYLKLKFKGKRKQCKAVRFANLKVKVMWKLLWATLKISVITMHFTSKKLKSFLDKKDVS